MPYLLIGIFLLVLSIIFLRDAIRGGDKEGVVGVTALVIASIILIVLFGFLYASYFRGL